LSSGHAKRSAGQDRRSDPAPDAVRAQLEQIFASAEFTGSKRTRSFLRFVVEETLAGRADRLKAYTIATAIFDRDETFDPQSDPIVRIEAGRVRSRLERYYLVAGPDDPIRIDMPKGGYVPSFTLRSSDSTSKAIDVDGAPARQGWAGRRLRRPFAGGALAAAVLLILGGGWLTIQWKLQQPQAEVPAEPSPSAGGHSRPSIIVMPFENLSGDPSQGYFARGVAEDIVRRLIRYNELTVFDGASLDRGEANVLELRRKLDAGYVLAGSVQRTANQIRVSSQLIDNTTEAVLWADTLNEDLSAVDLFAIQDDIARTVARTVASPMASSFRMRCEIAPRPPRR
jgi:TolB-like protein